MKDFITKVSLSFIAMLAPIHPVMISVGVLIFADTVFGIWAAHKRGERITSHRMGHTVGKMFAYQGVLVTGFFVQTHLLTDFIPVVKIIAGYIALVEFKSLLENASAILGKDIFKELIAQLGSKSNKNPEDPKV